MTGSLGGVPLRVAMARHLGFRTEPIGPRWLLEYAKAEEVVVRELFPGGYEVRKKSAAPSRLQQTALLDGGLLRSEVKLPTE